MTRTEYYNNDEATEILKVLRAYNSKWTYKLSYTFNTDTPSPGDVWLKNEAFARQLMKKDAVAVYALFSCVNKEGWQGAHGHGVVTTALPLVTVRKVLSVPDTDVFHYDPYAKGDWLSYITEQAVKDSLLTNMEM